MSASSRSRSTSGVPVPKASSRTTRATSKLLADQQQKIAFPVGPLSPSIRDPSRSKVLPAQYSERSAAGPSERPKDVQGEEEEEEVLRDSVEAAPVFSRPNQRRVHRDSRQRAVLTSKQPKDVSPVGLVPPSSLTAPVRRPFQVVTPSTTVYQLSGSALLQPSIRAPNNRRTRVNDWKNDVQNRSMLEAMKAPATRPGISEDEVEDVLVDSVGPSSRLPRPAFLNSSRHTETVRRPVYVDPPTREETTPRKSQGATAATGIRRPSGTSLPQTTTRASTSRRVPADVLKTVRKESAKEPVMEAVEESSSSEDWDDMVIVNPGGPPTRTPHPDWREIMRRPGVVRNAGQIGNPPDDEAAPHPPRDNIEVSSIRRPAKTESRSSVHPPLGEQPPVPTPDKAPTRTARGANRGMPVFAKPADPPARVAPSRSKAAVEARKAATPSKRTPVQGSLLKANQGTETSTKTSTDATKRPELPREWRDLSPDSIAVKLTCERNYTRAAVANNQKTRLTEDDIRYLRGNLRKDPGKRRERRIPERSLSPSDWTHYLEEQADRIKLEQQDQEASALATDSTPPVTSNAAVTEKTGSARKPRQTIVLRPPLWLSDGARQPREEAEAIGFWRNVKQASVPPANRRTPVIAPNNVVTPRIVSHSAATPSRIPRPDYVRAKGTSPLLGASPLVIDAVSSRSTIRPTPQQILFPRMASASETPNSRQTPNGNTAILSPTEAQRRARQMSTASDIDDKLRQSMLRMARISALSTTSPISVFEMESGASPSSIGRRTLKQSPLANVKQSALSGEPPALSPSIDNVGHHEPLGPIRRPRQPTMQFVSATPVPSAYIKLQQMNKDLEEEKMNLEFDVRELHIEAVQDREQRRDEEVARRWREVASACQAELAQLKAESAQRKREMANFGKMVTLAKLVV